MSAFLGLGHSLVVSGGIGSAISLGAVSDTSRANTIILTDDPIFTFNVNVSETWTITMHLKTTVGSVEGIKFKLSTPLGSAGGICIYDDTSGDSFLGDISDTIPLLNINNSACLILSAVVLVGVNGSIKLQWAQNVSGSNAAIIESGSTLLATRSN